MSRKKSLLDLGGDSDSETEGGNFGNLSINTNYAERYNKWRGGEELQKFKDRYGNLEEDEESSTTSEEEWTEDKEKEFFKTFSLLKKKDPKIYDSNVRFFQQTEETAATLSSTETKKTPLKKDKAFLIKDHERKILLEEGAEYAEESETRVKVEPTYVEEQANIKKGFSDALKTIDSDEEGDDYMKSDLLKKRSKTPKEENVEEEDYRQWLKGEVDKIKQGKVGDELKFLKEYWTDPNLNESEKFLRDYILNRKYRETDDSSYIPSYDEVVHDSDEEGLSGDEKNLEQMEEFEHKYNFRFEEPDQDFIKRYPRTIESTMRRAEDKRKVQREAAKERKEAEKAKKREEVQRLKAIKREEILEKLKQLESITGDPNLAFADEDVEGDFDPEAHDKRMQKIFNDEYYGHEDEEKPVFPSDDELDEEWKAYCPSEEEGGDPDDEEPETTSKKKKKQKNKKQDQSESADQDSREPTPGPSRKRVDEEETHQSVINDLIESSKGKRGKKKKTSVFLEALERSKPKFDPKTNESYQKYFDEYYKLDFEDLIGDTPCRFKYRKVTANDFGLSVEEILKAPDRELNQWASLKKTYQYRTPEEESYDKQAYEQKGTNPKRKEKLIPSLFRQEEEPEEEEQQQQVAEPIPAENGKKKKRRKNKKKKKKNNNTQAAETTNTPEPAEQVEPAEDIAMLEEEPTTAEATPSKKGKKKKNKKNNSQTSPALPQGEKSPEESTPLRADMPSKGNGTPTSNNNPSNKNKNKRKAGEQNPPGPSKKSKKDGNNANKDNNKLKINDERLRAYGLNPTKFKKQLKYGNKNN